MIYLLSFNSAWVTGLACVFIASLGLLLKLVGIFSFSDSKVQLVFVALICFLFYLMDSTNPRVLYIKKKKKNYKQVYS